MEQKVVSRLLAISCLVDRRVKATRDLQRSFMKLGGVRTSLTPPFFLYNIDHCSTRISHRVLEERSLMHASFHRFFGNDVQIHSIVQREYRIEFLRNIL